ncbi:hypothetical protein GIB67_041050 [Kingdonia uniflora]|uniref:Uncharacterized protein n=1 Tax=Kingdonia uniflora TaxID=39325 RepID=A0A7J7LS74_9MAGN|nr:hypothetical protein GIB67_041050 [Kingdonia uniflora]
MPSCTFIVEKDVAKGMGAGWERFEFNKDAPLDDEEEIEAAEDDSAVVKSMGQSFRFSAVEARRKEQINAAHDEAMFGAPRAQSLIQSNEKAAVEDDKAEDHNRKEINKAMFGSPTAQSPIQSDEEPVVVDDRLEDDPS